MLLKREKLINHLQRIACGGQVQEAVFTGTFATAALTPDAHLLVVAPSVPAAKGRSVLCKKGDALGMAQLPLLMKSLSVLSGTGNEAIDVEVELRDVRLHIDEGERGSVNLLTAQPKTISTVVESEFVDELMAKVTPNHMGSEGIPLTRTLIEGIRNTFAMLKAIEVEVFVGPEGGKVRVGNEKANVAEFPSTELVAKEECALLFGPHLVDVLGVVTNFSEARLYFNGPDTGALIDDGGYKYVIMPSARGADA